jgi:hypothetical protein
MARPVQQRVELCAQGHAYRRGDGDELPRNLIERVAQAVAETHPREERPHTLGRAVEAIREDPSDPIRGLPLGCGAFELPIGLGQGYRTGGLAASVYPRCQRMRPLTIVGR